jgi:hypothetical protein
LKRRRRKRSQEEEETKKKKKKPRGRNQEEGRQEAVFGLWATNVTISRDEVGWKALILSFSCRELQRVWIECMDAGVPECDYSNPSIKNFTRFLMKAPEHTWGIPGVAGWGGGDQWNRTLFWYACHVVPLLFPGCCYLLSLWSHIILTFPVHSCRSLINNSAFMDAASTWAEQRIYNELAVQALEYDGHPLAAEARARYSALLGATAPDTTG